MKKNHSFAAQYPYLAHWIEDYGQMQIGIIDDKHQLMLMDKYDLVYEAAIGDTLDEALEKAEKYVRASIASDYFEEERIEVLEEVYKNRD